MNETGDLFGDPPPPPKPPRGPRGPGEPPQGPRHRKWREPMREWMDPRTGEVHRCPERYMRVIEHLKNGREGARRAVVLLRLMGEPTTQVSQRHLRKAVFILQGSGWLVVSEHSAKGGYFIPMTREEVEQYCHLHERLARSMLSTVQTLREAWYR